MADTSERRGGRRVPLFRDVTVRMSSRTLDATALDVGLGGAALWSSMPAPAQPLELSLELDDGGRLDLAGKVVREFTSDGGSVWGIEFHDLTDETLAKLRGLVGASPVEANA